jgi:hypothetical protein
MRGTRKRIAAALALAGSAGALAGCASAGPATPTPAPVRVGIVGDQTWAADLDAAYAILEAGVARLAAEDLDLVLHVGDLVESSREPDEVRRDFARAAAILDRLPVPWYLAPGDHDVNPPRYRQDSPDRSRERLFQELYGERAPQVRRHPWHSFDAAGLHVVALDSQQALHADPRFGDTFLARIREDQLAWLEADLASRPGAPTVVFLHQPLWYQWSGWQPVHELLRRHRVVAVVSGHLHYDQAGGRLDGIEYLTVGATGGATKKGSRDAGAVHHVSVLEVAPGGGVELRLIPLSGDLPLSPTPRRDMDRVQALDVQLGSLFDFADRNPLRLRQGSLVADCAGGRPAALALGGLGNPLDVPLEVVVEVALPPGVTAAGPGFTPGQCGGPPDPGRCDLPPGARVALANPSSVEPDPAAPPLWRTTLEAATPPPAPGAEVRLTVRTAFRGESGPLFLTRTVTTVVAPCPGG